MIKLLAYTIDSFTFRGRIRAAEFAKAKGVEGDWSKALLATGSPRHGQFPLELDIIDFPERSK